MDKLGQEDGGIKKMKQKIINGLICSVLVILLSTSAYAAEVTEYSLEELGLSVSMPSEYIVFTRDIDANNPNLNAYELTKDGLSLLMEEKNIYLNGWDENVNQEIIITMIESPLVDFNLFSDTTLSIMATFFESEYANAGVTVIKSEIYQHFQAKFLKIYISRPNGNSTTYGLQYYTVYHDKAINITLQSYSGQITSSQEEVLKSIVDSVIFDTAPQIKESGFTPTNAFLYTDSKTQTSFVVPANWVETPLERESLYVTFASLEEDGMTILYRSSDAWNEMPASARSGYSRSDIDNSIFSKADVAEIYGLNSSDIELVTYGEKEYYKATVISEAEVYGMRFSVTMTQMILIDNGYMYFFQFSGANDNKFYGDFESLLTSAKFKNQISSSYVNSGALRNDFSFENILLSLIVTISVYTLPIIIYRYAIRRAPQDAKKAKRITIIYGVFAFIFMSAIIVAINGSGAAGGAILLWSYVNYRILIGGKSRRAEAATDGTYNAASNERPVEASAAILNSTTTNEEVDSP